MKKIVVGSDNPAKLEAVEIGFSTIFPHEKFAISSVQVDSGVAAQPMSDEETAQGAKNRALAAKAALAEADYWVGIEGGLDSFCLNRDELLAFSWVVIFNKQGLGKARSASFVLPPPVSELIGSGVEMGEADDIVFNQKDTKRSSGGVGLLTDDKIKRSHFYAEAVALALIPLINLKLYNIEEGHVK